MEAPLEPAVTDISILVALPPRGLGLDLEDRGLSETLKRNPEALTKEAVNHLVKRRFMTAIAGTCVLRGVVVAVHVFLPPSRKRHGFWTRSTHQID